jgi:hypothetical protein
MACQGYTASARVCRENAVLGYWFFFYSANKGFYVIFLDKNEISLFSARKILP